MSKPLYPELFPIAFGNEEETMMMAGTNGAPYTEYVEPVSFVSNYRKYVPDSLKSAPENNRTYLQGGNLVYNGGRSGSANLERATPECSTPTEFAAAVQANEQLLVEMTSNYVKEMADTSLPTSVRLQRRVADSYGNTRASHDNFESRNSQWLRNFEDNGSELLLLAHLATRSFITGAGYVTPFGLRFGQKVEHTNKLDDYGFLSSAYRRTTEANTGPRVEIRCSDINISPWALRQRIGTSALYLTMLQTPLANVIREFLPGACRDPHLMVSNLQRFNRATMDNEGQLQKTRNLVQALDFQQNSYELMAESLGDFVEIPDEYSDLIQEGIRYCDDFRAVLKGVDELDILSNRSDVAAKFCKIAASVRRGRETGFKRTPQDIISQAWDLRYDLIEIHAGSGNKPRVEYGYGYKHRDNGGFRYTPSAREVESAFYNPPKTTRAFVRGTMIKKGMVADSEWSRIRIWSDDESLQHLNNFPLSLNRVVIDGLTKASDVIDYVRSLKPLTAI